MILKTTEPVNLETLKPYPGNARRGDIDMIAESLRTHGQYKPIVVQKSTGYVLAGNHTLQAARHLGWDSIVVSWVDVDDDSARKINLIDNRSNDVATYDDSELAALLVGLDGDYVGTGFTDTDLTELMESLGEGGFSRKDKDAAPELHADPVTQLGDVIRLGDHVLVCGDALVADDRDALMEGQLADLVLTDPPYMVSYEADLSADDREKLNRRRDAKTVPNDNLQGIDADLFIANAMRSIHDVLKPGGVFYTFAPPGADELRFRIGLQDARLPLREVILWIKDQFVFGRQDYHWRHESLLYGWRDGAAHYFVDDRTQDTIWDCPRPKTSKDHPTQKPVALLERAIANSSRRGQLVVDLFAGSGSTLIAAHAQARVARVMERDPAYCDVIVERWEKLTGKEAER